VVCLEKPFPDKEQKKVGNPGPEGELIKLSETFPVFIHHSMSCLLMMFV
jgi:hypothetical protein